MAHNYFLTVAHDLGFISRASARRIIEAKAVYGKRGEDQPVGMVGIKLGLLSPDQAERAHREQDNPRHGKLQDVLISEAALALPLGAIRFLIVFLALAAFIVSVRLGADGPSAASVIAFFSTIIDVAVQVISVPGRLKRPLSLVRRLFNAFITFAWIGAGVVIANEAMAAYRSSPSASWPSLVFGLGFVVGSGICVLRLVWLKRSVVITKDQLLLVAPLTTAVSDKGANGECAVEAALRTLTSISSLHPYQTFVDAVLRRIPYMHRRQGAPSFWYFAPSGDGFRVVAFSVLAPPAGVRECLGKLAAQWRPPLHDQQKLNAAIEEARKKTTRKELSARDAAFSIENRFSYVSLVGSVFASGQALYVADTAQCATFNAGYRKLIEADCKNLDVREWAEFRSMVLLPVFEGELRKPVGVLVGCKNVANGFMETEWSAALAASRFLSYSLHFASPDKATVQEGTLQ